MALKVIGAGLGRTGTESLKMALEHLGFGKCYHMFELTIKDPAKLKYWQELMDAKVTDYDALFDGYQSCVDFPAAIYYREFFQQYPNAKVILTVRDQDAWYTSASKTIFRKIPAPILLLLKFFGIFSKRAAMSVQSIKYAAEIVHQRFFLGRINDPNATKKIYRDWNEEVKRTIPTDKLLVFEVKDGWKPLCEFLNVPVPNIPFPRSNDGQKFKSNLIKRMFSKEYQASR
ncbi:MAG: sulfotransferase family protein [Saprospiraceae bacterium]|nr:sulfotransferase family protein [Saprospiraceae bacterium]